MVNPLVTDTPCMDQSPDPIEQELPDLYPSCAVTRAIAKKAMLTENQSDIDLTDSFIGQSFKNKITKSRKETRQKLTQLSSRSYPRHLVGKRTAQKDITIDTTSDSQVNSSLFLITCLNIRHIQMTVHQYLIIFLHL